MQLSSRFIYRLICIILWKTFPKQRQLSQICQAKIFLTRTITLKNMASVWNLQSSLFSALVMQRESISCFGISGKECQPQTGYFIWLFRKIIRQNLQFVRRNNDTKTSFPPESVKIQPIPASLWREVQMFPFAMRLAQSRIFIDKMRQKILLNTNFIDGAINMNGKSLFDMAV